MTNRDFEYEGRKNHLASANLPADVPLRNNATAGSGFDYGSVPPETAESLREKATRVRERVENQAQSIVVIGHLLRGAKEMLEHGQFVQWVERECGFSLRSAQNYLISP